MSSEMPGLVTEITSLGKDIAPHIAGLLGAVLGATSRVSNAVKNTAVRMLMERLSSDVFV